MPLEVDDDYYDEVKKEWKQPPDKVRQLSPLTTPWSLTTAGIAVVDDRLRLVREARHPIGPRTPHYLLY